MPEALITSIRGTAINVKNLAQGIRGLDKTESKKRRRDEGDDFGESRNAGNAQTEKREWLDEQGKSDVLFSCPMQWTSSTAIPGVNLWNLSIEMDTETQRYSQLGTSSQDGLRSWKRLVAVGQYEAYIPTDPLSDASRIVRYLSWALIGASTEPRPMPYCKQPYETLDTLMP